MRGHLRSPGPFLIAAAEMCQSLHGCALFRLALRASWPVDSRGGVIELVRTKSGRGLACFFIICSTAGAFAGWSAYSTQPTESALTGAQFEPVEPVRLVAMTSSVAPVVSNRDAKGDRLAVTRMVLASADPSVVSMPESLAAAPVVAETVPLPPVKPKLVAAHPAHPAPPALDESQIAVIKARLRLTPSQEQYWPAVEQALRDVLRQHVRGRSGAQRSVAQIDVNSPEVQRLTWAAFPLLMQLREDQKHEVRKFARTIGLDQVASQI
jgi:hypothetical protein